MITSRKKEYVSIREKLGSVKYVPDERYLTWYNNKKTNRVGNLKMSIIMEVDGVSKEMPSLFSIYEKVFYQESILTQESLRDIILDSDIIICQSYNVHMASIILEKPFITFRPDREVKNLLTDIGIKHYRDIYKYINLWPKHIKLIEKYNLVSYNRLLKV